MDNQKTNAYYLQKIITDLDFVIQNTQGLSQKNMRMAS